MAGTTKLTGKHLLVAQKSLENVTTLFEYLNIDYIVDCGTLLGIIRENRLLPWDDDVDLSIKRQDIAKLKKNLWRLWLKGYRTHIRKYKHDQHPFKPGNIRLIKIQTKKWFFFKKDNVLDIFVKDKVANEYQMLVSRDPTILQGIPLNFIDETVPYNFNDKTYSIPKDYKEYLTYIYGDWQTPVKEWDFRVDAKSNKEPKNLASN